MNSFKSTFSVIKGSSSTGLKLYYFTLEQILNLANLRQSLALSFQQNEQITIGQSSAIKRKYQFLIFYLFLYQIRELLLYFISLSRRNQILLFDIIALEQCNVGVRFILIFIAFESQYFIYYFFLQHGQKYAKFFKTVQLIGKVLFNSQHYQLFCLNIHLTFKQINDIRTLFYKRVGQYIAYLYSFAVYIGK